MATADEAFSMVRHQRLDDGSRVELEYKAWRSQGRILWEIRRTLPSIGLLSYSANTEASERIRNSLDVWAKVWELLEFSVDACYVRSRKKVLYTQGSTPADLVNAEQEQGFTTLGLLTFLLFSRASRRNKTQREKSRQVLALLLLETLLPVSIDGFRARRPPLYGSCGEDVLGDRCACCRGLHEQLDELASGGPPRTLRQHFSWFQNCDCVAVLPGLRRLLVDMADAIDENVTNWGDRRLENGGILSFYDGGAPDKRRRIDEHLKARIAREHTLAGQVLLGRSEATSSDLRKWLVKDLCNCRAAGALLLSPGGALWTALDAARVGRPASELLLHAAWKPEKDVFTILAPAVPA